MDQDRTPPGNDEDNVVLAFDVYGTLLSTESIARQLAGHVGEDKAASVASDWRRYQLEYTWRSNSMNAYEPFSSITLKSLTHALASHSTTLPESTLSSLLSAYNSLAIFPDVTPLFTHLASSPHIAAHLFSNGTPTMIHTSLNMSPSLSPHANLFTSIVTVEPVRKFKPHPDVYAHLCASVGKTGKEGDVWLVSGNPFDVVGAEACGLRTCWVDRAGGGWVDRLGGRPSVVVSGVGDVVGAVERFRKEGK